MGNREDELGLEDTSFFTDADWAALNKLLDILRDNGSNALKSAWAALARDDPVQALRIASAFSPTWVSNLIKDELAEAGVTKNDLEDILRRAEPPKH